MEKSVIASKQGLRFTFVKLKASGQILVGESVYELDEFKRIKQKCSRFAMDNIKLLESVSPKFPESIGDRDNWHRLLGISEIAGKDWP